MSISLKSITSKPTNPPFLQNLSTHFFIKLDRIHIPIKHNPLHPPVPHLRRLRRHCRQQHFPEPFPPITLPHEQVFNIEAWFGQERRVIGEEEHKPSNDRIGFGRFEEMGLGIGDGEVEIERFGNRGEERGGGVGGEERGGGEGEFEEEDGEGVERRRGGVGEEGGGEGRLGGGEEVGEALEDGHLVDEFVDVGDV